MKPLFAALAFALVAAAQAPLNCSGKLSEEQLTKLVAGKVPELRLLQYVNQCGIGFAWSASVRTRLSRAGATPAVLSAVQSNAEKPVRPPAIPAAKPVVPTPEKPAVGARKVNSRDGLTYVWIPPGTFRMGCSPVDSECYDDEKPAHQVTITKGFWLGQTEVTQEAYQRVMGANPSNLQGPKRPVETVNWNEAEAFCRAAGMRLPTEAEWEYAARAGSTGSRYGDLDHVAWYSGNSGSQTHDVGQKQPNAWGLCDMLGNVWEWTADRYAGYTAGGQNDPRGPDSGTARTLRGGSWDGNPWVARVSDRGRNEPASRNFVIGLRCAGN
jgi:formylglycine-generating enzyme required for sulfatase activity